MMFELTTKSTSEARYDNSVKIAVTEALASVGLSAVYSEGGTMYGPNVDPDEASENHFGIEVDTVNRAVDAAGAVADRIGRPVMFYAVGEGVDRMTTPHVTVQPLDTTQQTIRLALDDAISVNMLAVGTAVDHQHASVNYVTELIMLRLAEAGLTIIPTNPAQPATGVSSQ